MLMSSRASRSGRRAFNAENAGSSPAEDAPCRRSSHGRASLSYREGCGFDSRRRPLSSACRGRCSSVGRAALSYGEGRRFDSGRRHSSPPGRWSRAPRTVFDSPVVHRPRRLRHKQEKMVRFHPGLLYFSPSIYANYLCYHNCGFGADPRMGLECHNIR